MKPEGSGGGLDTDGRSFGLIRPAAAQNAQWSTNEKVQVGPQVLVVGVPEVHADPVFEADLAAAADLPEASEPGLHGKPAELPSLVLHDFGGDRRPGTDQRHVSEQDVEQLRHLVDARRAEEATDL